MTTKAGIDKQVLAFGKVENTDKQYLPLLVNTHGQPIIPHDTEISQITTMDIVTIANGIVSPVPPVSIIGELHIEGEGDADDDLDTISANTTFEGKILILRKTGTGIITVKRSVSLLLVVTNFVLSSEDDCLALEWKSANIWRELFRANCG